jgi:hypothetical protein
MDLEIKAICYPDHDCPAMQNLIVTGELDDGQRMCTLEALRWAEVGFDIAEAGNLVSAFDEHSAFAYGLAEDVRQYKQ